jgi:hypothetical protein
MKLCLVHGKCPYWLLDEWMSSVDFLQVRRVERATETRRKFCFWLATGLPRHARRRGSMGLPRHPQGRGNPGAAGSHDNCKVNSPLGYNDMK